MKQPEEPSIGTTRKSLPTRKSRKMQKVTPANRTPKKREQPVRRRNILDKDVEKELVKAFGEK